MAESVTIARPYALAVFRLAREAGTQTVWSERLQRLSVIVQDPEMAKVVGNPKFSAGQVADLFISLFSEEKSQELAKFVGVLAENERLSVLPEIREIYEQLKSADEGIEDAVITSAFPLDDAQLNNLMTELEAHFGTRLEPHLKVDARLIGGVRVAVGDRILDASVRGKLDAMSTALKN
jgi:F-type H+-transporting ATPase subunit delta